MTRPDPTPYANAGHEYLRLGWAPIPVRRGSKAGVPSGWTGRAGAYPSGPDVQEWTEHRGGDDVGLRMPPTVIGIDVDHYGGKRGGDTIALAGQRWGELPPTYSSSAREDGVSGIYFYQVPHGTELQSVVTLDGLGSVEIVQAHHRYARVSPTVHERTGRRYQWCDPDGDPIDYPPRPGDLPELPSGWLEALAARGTPGKAGERMDDVAIGEWLDALPREDDQRACLIVPAIVAAAETMLIGGDDVVSRHDAMLTGPCSVMSLLRRGEQGHRGAQDALRRYRAAFLASVVAERGGDGSRDEREATREWRGLVLGAVPRIAATPTPDRAQRCCPTRLGPREAEDLGLVDDDAEPLEITPEPDRFIDRRDGLLARTLLDAVEELGPLSMDHTGQVRHYRGGSWELDGGRAVNARVQGLLGEKYRPAHLGTVISMLQGREALITDDTISDAYVNFTNGLVRVPELSLVPHDPRIITPGQVPVAWSPDADCPRIDSWLHEIMAPDVVELAYQVIGYAMLPHNHLHRAVLLYGTGRNGKGTFIRLLSALLGARNCASVSPQDLDRQRFRSAELYGKLANLVGDVSPKLFGETEVFKQLTGGDAISAERKMQAPFRFVSRALTVAAFNELPRTSDTSEGFYSRWLVLPFTGYFGGGRADRGLLAKLTAEDELAGLANRALRAACVALADGEFVESAGSSAAGRELRTESDPVRMFVDECTVVRPGERVTRAAWLRAYRWFAEEGNYGQLSAVSFGRRFRAALDDAYPGGTVGEWKVRGVRGWEGVAPLGIALTESAETGASNDSE